MNKVKPTKSAGLAMVLVRNVLIWAVIVVGCIISLEHPADHPTAPHATSGLMVPEQTTAPLPLPANQQGSQQPPPVTAGPVVDEKLKALNRIRLARRKEVLTLYIEHIRDPLYVVMALLPAARAGDAQAQWRISTLLDLCRYGTTDINQPPQTDWEIELRKECEPLNHQPPEIVGSANDWAQQAVGADDMQALLEQMYRTQGDPQKRADLFQRALATQDPGVLGAIVNTYDNYQWLGMSSEDQRTARHLNDAMMTLIACDMGMDCSMPSLQADCGSKRSELDCSYAPDVATYYQNHLTKAQFEQISTRAATLETEFMSGSTDWPEIALFVTCDVQLQEASCPGNQP